MFNNQSTKDTQHLSHRKDGMAVRVLIYGLLVVAVVSVGWLYLQDRIVLFENDVVSNNADKLDDSSVIEQKSLYFSGIPADGSNVFPNIFKLSLASDTISQITGEGYSESIHLSYVESKLHNGEFFVIAPGSVNEEFGYTQMEPVMVYPDPNEPLDSRIKIAQNISQTAGSVSHSFSLSPQEGHFSFSTLFDSYVEDRPSVNNPADWTVVVNIADEQEQRKTLTVPEATNPVWFDEERLMYIREDGLYVNAVAEDAEYQFFSASELGYASFTNSDKVTFLHDGEELIMAILKSNQNEIVAVAVDENLPAGLQSNHTIVERFQYQDDTVIMHHQLSISDSELAVVLVDTQKVESDEMVVFQLTDGTFTEIYRRPMTEFVPDSTILNYAPVYSSSTTSDSHHHDSHTGSDHSH